ncbi:MAG: 1-(5-phosphoribosyl)-5-[Selenomonadaceae bacterium]|nr:1-(5-phosphoribosyl)-5-[(5-phosphoribosylamino)methylideneamino]imidazole-4-carboxamide isomerase [Selenomonadaceae bacterium]
MVILPAIDLKGGKCVRLYQGDFDQSTVFSDYPEEMALKWQQQGAKHLHVVDLDGAKKGEPINIFSIKKILEAIDIPIEVGGGIRTLENIEDLLEMGVERVILGSTAVENPELIREAAREFGEQVIVGIDAKRGKVAVNGWLSVSNTTALDLAVRVGDMGISTIIYTDIAKDGTLAGHNAEATAELARRSGLAVIASGGVSSLDDIRALKEHEADGIEGIVIGRALYTGALNLADAINIAEE